MGGERKGRIEGLGGRTGVMAHVYVCGCLHSTIELRHCSYRVPPQMEGVPSL